MSHSKKNSSLLTEDDIAETKLALEQMARNSVYNTPSSFCADTERYPDNVISFADKHLNYLMSHKDIDPQQYLSNLRLMTRIA